MSGWTDLHNHVIPGVDDGARSVAHAVRAVMALRDEGVETVVATPHVDGSITRMPDRLQSRMDELDTGWDRLRSALAPADEPALRRGAEVKLDVPGVDFSDPRLRLAGTRAVLVEFAQLTVPPRSAETLHAIRSQGYLPVLAHPERYQSGAELSRVRGWVEAGAALQINVGSLAGLHGQRAARVAASIIGAGLAHCLASDYHGYGSPHLVEVREMLDSWGEDEARLLFEENPARLADGETPLAVPPLSPPPGFRHRLSRLLPWK
jgi:protein-tyrosine phosphatase